MQREGLSIGKGCGDERGDKEEKDRGEERGAKRRRTH